MFVDSCGFFGDSFTFRGDIQDAPRRCFQEVSSSHQLSEAVTGRLAADSLTFSRSKRIKPAM